MQTIQIRKIIPEEAQDFLSLRQQLDRETKFMLLEPGERPSDVVMVRNQLEQSSQRANQILLGAFSNRRLVGFLSAEGGRYRRSCRTAYVVVGILQEFTGQGLGTRLFAELDSWAHSTAVHRLELTVMSHNQPAIALYRKAGFKVEGEKKDVLWVDDAYVDELMMAKLLD